MEISIIVPVFNVEKYLSCCLDSLINQNFKKKYEIICINDGSTDSSLDILKRYQNYEKVSIIDQKNKGLSSARNTGIKYAKGKYIMFIDSDDYLKNENVLSLMYNEAEKNELDITIANFEYDFEDKRKNYTKERHSCIKNKVMSGKKFYDLAIKKKSIMSVVWNKLYKREFLLKNNLFFLEGVLYEDMEFTPKAFYLAEKVKYIDEVIYMYRQREGSITSNKNINRLDDYFIIGESLSKFNQKYNSKSILQAELYLYVTLIRKLRYVKEKKIKKQYWSIIKKKGIPLKFLKSNNVKYKIFGCLLLLG